MSAAAFEVPVWYIVLAFLFAPYHLGKTLETVSELKLCDSAKDVNFWIAFSLGYVAAIVAWPCTVAVVAQKQVVGIWNRMHSDEP